MAQVMELTERVRGLEKMVMQMVEKLEMVTHDQSYGYEPRITPTRLLTWLKG